MPHHKTRPHSKDSDIRYHAVKRELGVSGLKYSSGQIYEQYLSEIKTWDRQSKAFLEMRNDTIIGTLLDALKLPLLASPFDVLPAKGNAPIDQYVAKWLKENLDTMYKQTWQNHVEDCLSSIEFGFSVNLIQLEKRRDGRMWLHSLEPRGQETLREWRFDEKGNAIIFVQQDPNTYETYDIPLMQCIHTRYRGRKNNPQGESLMLSLYRPYRFLRDLENLEGIGIERDVGGMPVLKLLEGTQMPSGTNLTKIESALASIRQDEASYFITPPGGELGPYGSGSKMYDVGAVIQRKKQEVLMRQFCQFLMLGMDKAGTQALVEGSQDFFDYVLGYIQETLVQAWNQQLVPFIINRNMFQGITGYPEITWNPPGAAALKALSDFYKTMSDAKAITPQDEDEDYFRELAELPPLAIENRGKSRQPEPEQNPFAPDSITGQSSVQKPTDQKPSVQKGSDMPGQSHSQESRTIADSAINLIKSLFADRRPDKARNADGTWGDESKGGAKKVFNPRIAPAQKANYNRISKDEHHKIVDSYASTRAKFSSSDDEALTEWQGFGHEKVRAYQTGKSTNIEDDEFLASAFDKVLEKSPTYDGTTYRGLSGLSDGDIDRLAATKEITFDAHSSASVSSGVAYEFAIARPEMQDKPTNGCLLEIKGGNGKLINGAEDEVIISKGAKFAVTDRKVVEQKIYGKPVRTMVLTLEAKR